MVNYVASGYGVGSWHAGFVVSLRRNLVVGKGESQTDLTKAILCISWTAFWWRTLIWLAFLFVFPMFITL